MKRWLLLLTMLFLMGCVPGAPRVVPTDPVEIEEYAVYSALINSEFGTSPFDTLAFDDQSTLDCAPFGKIGDEFATLQSTSSMFQGLEQSTVDTYVAKNKVAHQLS